jgi:hypothetical protein
MSLTELLPALQKLDPADQLKVIQFLATELSKLENFSLKDLESKSWLEAELVYDLPDYNWGEAGIPTVKPVEYLAEIGFVVKEE